MSVGAFSGVIAAVSLQSSMGSGPLLLLVAMIIGGLFAGIAGLIIGIPVLRLRGDYLAIVTLAFGEIVKVIFENADAFGGAFGIKNAFRFNKDYLFYQQNNPF